MEVFMPNIKPISELRNYSALLESVVPGDPVFLTRNGHGAYALVDIADQVRAHLRERRNAL